MGSPSSLRGYLSSSSFITLVGRMGNSSTFFFLVIIGIRDFSGYFFGEEKHSFFNNSIFIIIDSFFDIGGLPLFTIGSELDDSSFFLSKMIDIL